MSEKENKKKDSQDNEIFEEAKNQSKNVNDENSKLKQKERAKKSEAEKIKGNEA